MWTRDGLSRSLPFKLDVPSAATALTKHVVGFVAHRVSIAISAQTPFAVKSASLHTDYIFTAYN